MDVKEKVKQIVLAGDSTLDLEDGSGIVDLLINPLSNVISYYENELLDITQNLSLENVADMDEDQLDGIASMFFIDRISGEKVRGYVKIFFSSAVNVTIPAGTGFLTADGKRYLSLKEYSISGSRMLLNQDIAPYYNTDGILVEAEETGSAYEISAGSINQVELDNLNYVKVSNSFGFTGGVEKETNAALYARILDSITSETASSAKSIKKILLKNFTTIKTVKVIGFGDVEMERDKNYNKAQLSNFIRNDFFGKVKNISEPPYNENIAGVFMYSGATPPLITNVSLNEYTSDQYTGIYKKGDALYAEALSSNILEDDFNSGLDTTWYKSDYVTGYNKLKSEDEIKGLSGYVRLGVSQATAPTLPVVIDQESLASLKTDLTNLVTQAMNNN